MVYKLRFSLVMVSILWLGICLDSSAQSPLQPDLFAWESESNGIMHDWHVDSSEIPGRWLLRFSTAITNFGDGPLELRVNDLGDGTQDIFQRVYQTSGNPMERLVGNFDIDPNSHGSLSLYGIAHYRLLEVVGNSDVGLPVAENTKTSHCVLDSIVVDASQPAAPTFPQYLSCHTSILGISVGYADLYGTNLTNQWIDVTGAADGTYWLEVDVDPFGQLDESDENNNVTRILIDLDAPDGQPFLDGTWRFDFSDVWTDAENWIGETFPNGIDSEVLFGSVISSPQTVVTNDAITVHSIQFDNPNSYAVGGNGDLYVAQNSSAADPRIIVHQGFHELQVELKLVEDAVIDTAAGSTLTLNNAVHLNGHVLAKSGAGELAVNNALFANGGEVVIHAGTVSGIGTIGGGITNDGGTISPGSNSAALSVVPEARSFSLMIWGIIFCSILIRRYPS